MNFKVKTLLTVSIVACAVIFASARLTPTRASHYAMRQARTEIPSPFPPRSSDWVEGMKRNESWFKMNKMDKMAWLGAVTTAIANLVNAFNDKGKAWDVNTFPYMCKFTAIAKNIGECEAQVTCFGQDTRRYGPFPHCNTDGVNTFEDPNLGVFSIEYTSKWYDTPSSPNFWFESVQNGERWDVGHLVSASDGYLCESDGHQKLDLTVDKTTYTCGVPMTTDSIPDDSEEVNDDPGYADGWCGIHVTQRQKPDPSKDNYSFDVTIKDANQEVIGSKSNMNIATDQTDSVESKLEWTVDIKAGAEDKDAVWMYYGAQAWSSNDQEHHCDFGAYDNGKREGDCGFTC